MILSFGLSAALALPLVVLVDLGPAGIAAVLAAHLSASVALYRHSRSLFLALDYLADPTQAPPAGDRRGSRPDLDLPPAPRPPAPGRRRARTAVPVAV
jgi:hypothetical protein